ncbi:hypothetical protein D1007_25943 [Hordeum vulgare]|nr:hypothetical protein D1007_25943 [Hordeum vulgare]
MAGRSKKAKQDNPPVASHDEVASHGNEEQQPQPPSGSTMIGHKRQSCQAIILRRKSPDDINSNQSLGGDSENVNAEGPTVDQPQNTKRQKTGGTEVFAFVASLNKDLNFEQKGVIIEKEFGGLLDLAANSMPGDLSQWIMRHYDPEMSQIVIPEMGKIPVDAASVRRIWGLPNRGRKVCFDNRPEITKAMYNISNITSKNSPTLTNWCKMIKEMNGSHDDDFVRAWLALAFSSFLAPSTSLSISPKSFPAVMDVNVITETNICQFVVDQLKLAFTLGRRNKKVVCCCVFHIVLLYLDSLDVDEPIPNLVPRVSVWNSDLISKVIKKDRKAPGEYDNLRLKTEFSRCADDSLFGSMDHITKFVATRLPESYDKTKQKKLTGMVHEMCSVISHAVGKLVTGFGRIDDDEWGARTTDPDDVETSRRQSKRRRQQVPAGTDSLPSDEESFISDDDGSEDDHGENDEVSEDKDNDGSEEDGSSDSDDGDEVGTSGNGGSGSNGGSGGTRPSVDDEQCTLQFLFEKRRHNKKKKSRDEADSICVRDLVMTDLKTVASPTPCFSLFEMREMLDIEDRSLALEAKRIFEELLSAKDLDLSFTFNPEKICPKEIRRKVMREIGSALEVGEPKQVGHNQVRLPPFPKKKKSVSFILEPIVMNETGGDPQTFRSENSKYGQGGKARQPTMKESGASQQQYEAISEVKEASNGNDETQLLNNMLPQLSISRVRLKADWGKLQDLKASPQAVLLNDAGLEKEKENIPPTVSCMEIKREQDKIVETTTNISEQKLLTALGKLPVCSTVDAKHEAKSVSEVVQESSQENLFHLSDVEDRFQKFMSLSGNSTNALEVNVLDVSELSARFAHPNSKNPQINPTKIEQQHQSKSERSAAFYSEYCPAPSFDLGIDDLPIASVDDRAHQSEGSSGFDDHEFKELSVPMHPTIEIIDDDYVFDLEGIDELCAEAGCSAGIITEQNMYQTPQKNSKQGEVGSGSKIYSSSSSGEMPPQRFERRIIKPPPCKRSPFIDYNEKKVYMSKPEANRLYASVILHGRLNEEASPDADTSAMLIEYGGYFVTVRELAKSMKKEGFVLSHVMEVGIQSIMFNLPPDSKKVLMPLRFSIWLQKMELTSKELIWTVKIWDRRFEVLDSWRTLKNKSLDVCARKIVASVRVLWEEHYARSHTCLDDFGLVNIDVPQQDNEFDCGIFALTIANSWDGRAVPKFTAKDVPNIRKQLTNSWVDNVHNNAPWKAILKLAMINASSALRKCF